MKSMEPERVGEGEGSGMRWSVLLAVIGLSITDVESFAQRQPADERLSSTREGSKNPTFFKTTGMVRFQFIQGRLCLNCPQHRKGTQSRDEPGISESITVTSERGVPSLHYVLQTKEQQLTLNVQHAGNVRLESRFLKSGKRAILEQPTFEMIRWSLSDGEHTETRDGATLLHLREHDPEAFDLHFGPLIACLLRGKSLISLMDETSLAMVEQARRGGTPSVAEIKGMVELLSAPTVVQRSHAHRQLLTWGTPVIPVLQALGNDDLNAEQRARIRDIRNCLSTFVDDTPASLAKLLVNDRSYWQVTAHRFNEGQVMLANRHLEQFGAAPLSVVSIVRHRVAARAGNSLK
ncbi:MAG: hypothetical protein ACR2N1_13095 [Rubripirellula sp.]